MRIFWRSRSLSILAPALLVGACFYLGFTPASGLARDINQDEALQLRREGKLQPLDALLQTVQQRYPAARILEVELESDDSLLIYELEILTGSGQVRELEFNASTGTLIKDEEED